MATYFLGIRLGSTTTCIYKSGGGIVLREPSLIAMSTDLKDKEVKAIGTEARNMIGKTSDSVSIYSPISNGAVQYKELATLMLKGFLKKIFPGKMLGNNIKAIVCVPLGLTPAEKKDIEITCYKAGLADVFIVPDVLAYCYGDGINVETSVANMVVNIGGDTTNIATIANNSIISGYSLSFGGNIINVAISKYVEENYDVKISFEQANRVKHEICSLYESYSDAMEIEGINKKTQSPTQIVLHSNELNHIVCHYYDRIAEAILAIINESDTAVASDIAKNGIYFYGGGAEIIGLDKFIQSKLNYKANITDTPRANLLGTAEFIKYPQLLKKIIRNN